MWPTTNNHAEIFHLQAYESNLTFTVMQIYIAWLVMQVTKHCWWVPCLLCCVCCVYCAVCAVSTVLCVLRPLCCVHCAVYWAVTSWKLCSYNNGDHMIRCICIFHLVLVHALLILPDREILPQGESRMIILLVMSTFGHRSEHLIGQRGQIIYQLWWMLTIPQCPYIQPLPLLNETIWFDCLRGAAQHCPHTRNSTVQ